MTSARPTAPLVVLSISALVWLAASGLAIWAPSDGHWPLRVAALIAAMGLVVILRGEARLLAVSPLVALAVIPLLFYSLVPAAFFAVSEASYIVDDARRLSAAFVAGRAHLLVLQFAAMWLAVTIVVAMYLERRPDWKLIHPH